MTLQSNQRKALENLIAGSTVAQTAAIVGVSEKTIYRWKAEHDDFQQALKEANDRILSDTVMALTVASVKAVQALVDVLDDDTAEHNHKISAAKAILDSTINLRKLYDHEERIIALEAQAS